MAKCITLNEFAILSKGIYGLLKIRAVYSIPFFFSCLSNLSAKLTPSQIPKKNKDFYALLTWVWFSTAPHHGRHQLCFSSIPRRHRRHFYLLRKHCQRVRKSILEIPRRFNTGCDLVKEVAEFWISRTQLNTSTGFYDITGDVQDNFKSGMGKYVTQRCDGARRIPWKHRQQCLHQRGRRACNLSCWVRPMCWRMPPSSTFLDTGSVICPFSNNNVPGSCQHCPWVLQGVGLPPTVSGLHPRHCYQAGRHGAGEVEHVDYPLFWLDFPSCIRWSKLHGTTI